MGRSPISGQPTKVLPRNRKRTKTSSLFIPLKEEPLWLRHHRKTYPNHLLVRQRGYVTMVRQLNRLMSDIIWDDSPTN